VAVKMSIFGLFIIAGRIKNMFVNIVCKQVYKLVHKPRSKMGEKSVFSWFFLKFFFPTPEILLSSAARHPS
jgi:hypothetical protein